MKLENPFAFDPFAIVWEAFKRLYPTEREIIAVWDHVKTEDGERACGATRIPEKEDERIVIFINPTINVFQATKILAHELAHVATPHARDHGPEWDKAFEAIFEEYGKISHELMPDADEVWEKNE